MYKDIFHGLTSQEPSGVCTYCRF